MSATGRVRVLHLFVTLPVGGAENLLLSIVRKLDPARFESVVCCIGEKGAVGAQIEGLGVPLVELGLMRKAGWDGRVVPALARLVAERGIGLVHSHLYHANLYGRLAARRAGVPCIASIHNTYQRPKLHRRLVNRALARYTHTIIVGSAEIRADVMRYDGVPASMIEVIPNAVDLDRSASALSREQARARLDLDDARAVLGTIGRLEQQKGHRVLIEALDVLRARGITPIVLLVGEGREEARLRELTTRLGLNAQVRFLGTRRDLGDLFRAMDLFVMPSLWEGLSLAMLSAMGAGLPVVATRVGGVDEVMGEDEYGFRVPAGSAAALADRIAWCLAHPAETAAVARRGAERVAREFSDAAMVARLEAIYARALCTHASRSM